MKKLLLITLLLFFSLSISAQINYEPGYFINNEGQRTSCLIRNVDWKNNPTSFEYKLSENSDSQKASIETVIEFGISDGVQYERHTVKINRSSDDSSALERDRSVDFKEEQLFLKVLVEGEATLYYYENKNLRRFFFNPQNSHLEQLVYKRYRKSATEIRENTQFKQQLWNNFQCESISRNEINKLSYKEDNLVRLFRKFNVCINPDWVEKIKEKDQFIFNLSIRPGVNISSLLINNGTEYGSKASPRLGLEAEFVLPFNKNKWSILVEPTYRDYQNEATVSPLDWVAPSSLKVDYPSIEFAIGIRHYIFLNDKSKIFVTGYMLNDMEMDAMVSAPRDLTINPLSNFAGGFGYKYNGKVSLEFRYDGYRELLRLNGIQSKFRNISLILGYTFL